MNRSKSHQTVAVPTPPSVHFLAGILASTATRLLTPAERNVLKMFLYMRAANGFIQLTKAQIKSLLTKTQIAAVSAKMKYDTENGQELTYKKFELAFGEILFTSIVITICVYGYTFEPGCMNHSMYKKIDQLFNMQDYEVPTQKYFQMLAQKYIERVYRNHWY